MLGPECLMPPAAPEPIGRRDIVALMGLGLVAVGIPLWLSAAAGAIGIPSGDDWVYMRGASSLFATGSIDMPGHNAAAVGQLVLVQPLLWLAGGSSWAFTAFGLIMGMIGTAATYLLARRFVSVGAAALVVLLVLAFPGFARETATFVTDVPAYAFGTLCLLLGVRWLHGVGGRMTLIASMGFGLLAVSIREFAVAAPAAIMVAAWVRNRADERLLLVSLTGIVAAGFVAVILVADSIPGRSLAGGGGLSLPILLGPAFMTLAAALLPASILGIGRRMATVSPVHVLAGVGLVAITMVAVPDGPFLWGPLVVASGTGADAVLSGVRDAVIPERAWVVSQQLALIAAILAAALVLRSVQRHLARAPSLPRAWAAAVRIARSRRGPLLLFLLAYAGGLAVVGAINPIYDRYLYPMIPAAAILLLSGVPGSAPPVRSLAFAHAALLWLAGSTFVIAANTLAYDAARHSAGEAAVALGYPPGAIDAGYEWVGYHASGSEVATAHNYGLTWYDDNWPSFRPCAVLSNSPLDIDGYTLIREDRSAYRLLLFLGPDEPLFLYGATASGCPRPAAATTAQP
jgi:hypothetical protein